MFSLLCVFYNICVSYYGLLMKVAPFLHFLAQNNSTGDQSVNHRVRYGNLTGLRHGT